MREPRQQLATLHPPRSLPPQPTTFVGRQAEVAALTRLLAEPGCRLVTIVGPGGSGKSRLALAAAARAAPAFPGGVAFVPLQPVDSPEVLPAAIAVGVGRPLSGRDEPRAQLLRYLGDKELLLLLDNFEHLLDGAELLGDLLATAPGVKLLTTSREALNLQEEWRYPLVGLPLPADGRDDDPERSEAVQLFVERARRVRRDFALNAEREGVVRICRLVGGLPLAIELAAAWTRTLPCAAIADELARTLALEAPGLRNLPARHRSMRAVFEQSWARLGAEERAVYARLAVFRGGFAREAAERVAGATLRLLSSLVDKSLLRYEADGRFYLHELLSEYAAEHLAAGPGAVGRVVERHGAYYVEYLERRRAAMAGGGQIAATREIAAELDNVRAAWQRAVRRGDVAAIGRAAHPLALFYDFRGRYQEGLAMLEEGLRVLRAAAPSPQADRAIAAMLMDTARFHFRLSQFPAAHAALAESEELYARLGGPPPPGQSTDPRLSLGVLALFGGDYAEAARRGAEAVRRNTADDRPGNLPLAWSLQALAALWQEEYDAADEYARRAREAALAVGDRWYLAYCRNDQGHVATARGDYAEARRHYEAGYAIREEFGDPEGMAIGLGHLAKVAVLQGAWAEADELYRRGLAISREIGDQRGLAQALNGLGVTACATGDYVAAGRHFAEGLRLAAEVGYMRLLLTLLASAGDWLLRTGRPAEAAGTLALARDHPASDPETRARARGLLAAAAAALPPEAYAAAVERTRDVDAAELAARLAPVLAAPPVVDHAQAARPGPAPRSALAEPLTARELAVLRLIAAGRSNQQIADELYLAVNTVRSYSQQLYGKLGVGSRTQAIARARELGLLG